QFTVTDLLTCRIDRGGHGTVQRADVAVGACCCLFHRGECADEISVMRHRGSADREVLDGTCRVNSPVGRGGDFYLTQHVGFGAILGHVLLRFRVISVTVQPSAVAPSTSSAPD